MGTQVETAEPKKLPKLLEEKPTQGHIIHVGQDTYLKIDVKKQEITLYERGHPSLTGPILQVQGPYDLDS